MIFYFTATGNGKFIAERVATALNEQTINITECMQEARYIFELAEGENVGIVAPVYYFGIPKIMSEFLEKVKFSAKHNYYSYAILHCGRFTGNAGRYIQRTTKVDAIFGMVAPNNFSLMSFDLQTENEVSTILNTAEAKIDTIIESIKNKDVGIYNDLTSPLLRLLTPFYHMIYTRGRKTKHFKVNNKCTGCKQCEKICPRKVIDCINKKPAWRKPTCELCLACLNRCPVVAIEYGKSVGKGQYVNPRVNIS
jgi:NAD-dependent dihydropyrimidine dehydrogenase PreA subunit